jgi:hypothetical protein
VSESFLFLIGWVLVPFAHIARLCLQMKRKEELFKRFRKATVFKNNKLLRLVNYYFAFYNDREHTLTSERQQIN